MAPAGLLAVVCFGLAGCAANLSRAERLFHQGDYRSAAEAFRLEESDDLYNPVLKRMLAASWLRSGYPDRALVKLEESLSLEPLDPLTWFLLGDAHADRGDPESAIGAYQQYLALGGTEQGEVRARVHRLSREIMVREVRTAIEGERSAVEVDSTLVVSPFLNVSGSEALASLSSGLAAVLITDLRKVEGFRILERERLGVLLQELALGDSAEPELGTGSQPRESADPAHVPEPVGLPVAPPPVDTETAPEWGRLLGARQFVQGFFSPLPGDRILLGADLISLDGRGETAGAPLEGPLADVLYLEKGLVRRVLTALGVEPSEEEERALDEFLTGSSVAFFAFARGLHLLDQGRGAEARDAFGEAVAADPSFVEAAEAEAVAAATEESFGVVRDEIWAQLIEPGSEPEIDLGLIDVAVRVGGGPAPAGSTRGGAGGGGEVLGPSDPERIGGTRTIPTLPPPPAGAR